jgi:hypothetical protein
MNTTSTEQINALAAHTGSKPEDIKQSEYDKNIFEANGIEYLICSNMQATQRAGDDIKQSLWAFDTGFIVEHSTPEAIKTFCERIGANTYDDSPFTAIHSYCADVCEGANYLIEKMITDINQFIEDAISIDGRGHFLSTYDGIEYNVHENYIYQL